MDDGFINKLEKFEEELLHLEDLNNRQVNLYIEDGAPLKPDVFTLFDDNGFFGLRFFNKIKKKIGGGVSVYLKNSSLDAPEVGLAKTDAVVVDWRGSEAFDETRAVQKRLGVFIDSVYKDIAAKGTNVLFLSIGAIKWKTTDGVITSPLVIFPVKLIRKIDNQPVGLEFVDDDVYINECFYRLFTKLYGEHLEKFPLPVTDGEEGTFIDAENFDMQAYFDRVQAFVDSAKANALGETDFEFNPNLVAIARYTHDDICSYRDVTSHKKQIEDSPLIRRVFGDEPQPGVKTNKSALRFVLQYDGVQEKIIDEIVNGGECVKVQGPPGTGKTQTIANVIACAIAANKKVLFASKKVPALEEVYDKLPKELRPFVLKIESEKESLAVKMSPNELHKEFNATINYALPELNDTGVESKSALLSGKLQSEKQKLETYYLALFGDELKNGFSLYDALCAYCKDGQCPVIRFDEPSIGYMLTMDYATFENALASVKKLGDCFKVFTDGFAFSPRKSPFFGIKDDALYADLISDSKLNAVREAADSVANLCARYPETAAENLGFFESVASVEADEAFINAYVGGEDLSLLIKTLEEAYNLRNLLEEKGLDDEFVGLTSDGFLKNYRLIKPPQIKDLYLNYTLSSLARVQSFFSDALINRIRRQEPSLKDAIKKFDFASSSYDGAIGVFEDIFGGGIFDDEKAVKALRKAYPKLKKFFDGGEELKGFGAKSALNSVKAARKKDTPITDARLLEGLKAFAAIDDAIRVMAQEKERIASLLEQRLDKDTVSLLKLGFEFSREGVLMERAIKDINEITSWANSVFGGERNAFVADALKNGRLDDILRIADIAQTYALYASRISACNGYSQEIAKSDIFGEELLFDAKDIKRKADDLTGVLCAKKADDPVSFIKDAKKIKPALVAALEAILEFARANTAKFMGEFSIYHSPREIGYKDLNIFLQYAHSAQNRNAMYDFQKEIGLCDGLVLAFFRPFTVGVNEAYREFSFADIFVHSFFGLHIESVKAIAKDKNSLAKTVATLKKLSPQKDEVAFKDKLALKSLLKGGDNLNSVADGISSSLYFISKALELYGDFIDDYALGDAERLRAEYASDEDAALANNAKLVALRGIKRIRETVKNHSHAFGAFEGDKSSYRNVRLMFKNEAKVIMQLKNCFIMSPSAISSLMGSADYGNFDIAIFDEASQIEPQYLIPVLFRAKQCVIIGDEHQMPPIKHFVRNSVSGDDEDGDYIKMQSALDLVSGGRGAFKGYSLRCHYRSQSESLIAYSQRYYPDMITFPSKSSLNSRMGVRDEFVALGDGDFVKSGVNEFEAQRVIEILLKHFEENPSQSVGVMTFGDAQAQHILKLIAANEKLSRIAQGDSFFVKPIAKLQGKEVDHVIMSMTYARNERGVIASLGDLNRTYGEQIFNVAASRAKYALTVVHSFTRADIENSNVSAKSYLADFLKVVEQHSVGGGFAHESAKEAPNYFIQSVCKFLEDECEIARERILVNYGATPKSLRIPVVILDEALKETQAAIFLDVPPIVGGVAVNYIDFAIKYRLSLVKTRDWNKTIALSVYDWVNDDKHEKEKLKEFILNE